MLNRLFGGGLGQASSRIRVRPKRILFITGALAMGGAERQMFALAHGLKIRGYEIAILELEGVAPDQASFADAFAALGVKSRLASDCPVDANQGDRELDATGLRPFVSLFPQNIVHLRGAVAYMIRDFHPEVVSTWSDLSNVVGGFVASSTGVPRIVLGLRTAPPPFWFDGAKADLYRAAYRQLAGTPTAVMVSNSRHSAREFETWMAIPGGTIKVIYNGFLPSSIQIRGHDELASCRAQLGLPADAPVVGAVMRFAQEKDPGLWLETVALIAEATPDAYFLLAGYGHGNIAGEIRRKGDSLGLGERLVMPGRATDVGLIYGAIDVLLLTSRTENVPNVMIEAQAAGVPVVGPAVGGIGEAMVDRLTGLMARERTASCLAIEVLRVLADKGWRLRAAAAGPLLVGVRFGQERMLAEMISVLALGGPQREPVQLTLPFRRWSISAASSCPRGQQVWAGESKEFRSAVLKVLVTGSSGFIGSHVCRRLEVSGHQVVPFDIASGMNVLDRTAIEGAVEGVDAIFHFAAQPDLTTIRNVHDGDRAIDLNVLGTRNIASVCTSRGIGLVYVSTCCVYGDQPGVAEEDRSVPRPAELYSFSKLAGEEIVRGYAANFGLRHTILRIGTAYGAGMRRALGVHVFLDQALRGVDLTVHGDGLQTRALTYVGDLSRGIASLLDHPEATGEIINLASEEEISANRMAADICRVAKSASKIVHISDRPHQIRHQKCSGEKAARILGWRSETPWEEGLRKTFDWFSTQAPWGKGHVQN